MTSIIIISNTKAPVEICYYVVFYILGNAHKSPKTLAPTVLMLE